MAKKKKRHRGHYCKICGCYLPNEKFTGKGHARHICKSCSTKPKEVEEDIKWEDYIVEEEIDTDELMDELPVEPIPFAELERDMRYEIEDLLEANINEFMIRKDYIPEGKELQKINDWVFKETNDTFFTQVIPDDAYNSLVDKMIHRLVKEWKEDGFEIKTYAESLVVMETERLLIRQLTRKDVNPLLAFMGKPEVMYAWEHGFTQKDVRKWINRQLTRYRKEKIGYYAVILKENGKLIGQAGLMRSNFNEEDVVEIGYILDNGYWHHGYAIEAARACMEYAFEELNLKSVYCSIRPENEASIRVAEKLGMSRCGSHIVLYDEKEMPHLIYKVERKETP